MPALPQRTSSFITLPSYDSPVPLQDSLLLSDAYPLGSFFPGSLSVLLDDLQGLSEAISKEEAVSQGDNPNSPAPTCH